MTLPCGPTSPARARRFVRQTVDRQVHRDTIELLVSELVTNAVLYAPGRVELTIVQAGDRTRVEVRDASPQLPAMRTPDLSGGRGLHVVESLAAEWGVDGHLNGKTIWFEVAASGIANMARS
jgi:anti-sigma regulatory factor (Ser/Thr protein kinase)